MKKLLSILGAIVVTSTGASTVVACSDGLYSNAVSNSSHRLFTSAYDKDILEASLVSRAKSLILDDRFDLSDQMTKDYALNKNLSWFTSIVDPNNQAEKNFLGNKTVKDEYRNFIDDSSIATLDKSKTNISTNGEIGNEGGIFNKIENTLIGKVYDATIEKLPDKVQSIIKGLLGDLLNIKSGDSDVKIAETIKPLLQAVGKVDVKTALAGIPYAFKLLPSIKDYQMLVNLAGQLAGTLLGPLQKAIDPAIDKLANAVDLSDLGDKTLDQIPKEINTILTSLLTGKYPTDKTAKYTDSFTAVLRFVNLTGMYLSMIPHDTKNTSSELASLSSKKLSDNEYYKIGEGKTFNVAPVLNEVSYYLSDANKPERIQKLLEILFMKSNTELNEVGKNIVDTYIAPLINNLMDGQANQNDIEAAFIKSLTDDDEFKCLYTNWEGTKLTLKIRDKDVSVAEKVKQNIDTGGDLFHTFYDDVNTEKVTPSLKNLITLPIYKLLALGKVPGYEFDNDNLLKTGLLPNVAGYYTQESIVKLADEVTNMFSFNTADQSDVTVIQEQLKYHFFDFSKLKNFIDRLLFDKDSFLKTFIKDAPSDGDPAKVANTLAIDLGYAVGNDGQANPKYIFVKEKDSDKDTLIAEMVKLLLPIMDKDKYDSKYDGREVISDDKDLTADVINKSDSLKFMFSGLTSFVSNVIKGTNYDYWLSKVINNKYDNGVADPDGVAHAIFDYHDNGEQPDWDADRRTGITTEEFNNGDIKSMKLVIKFNLGDVPLLINGVQIKGNPDIKLDKYIYTFKISRKSFTDKFSFSSINRQKDQ